MTWSQDQDCYIIFVQILLITLQKSTVLQLFEGKKKKSTVLIFFFFGLSDDLMID